VYKMLILLCVAMLASCETWRQAGEDVQRDNEEERRSGFIESMCRADSLVGERSGFSALIQAKREELENVRAKITFEQYSALSQELIGYTVQWENLNQDKSVACKVMALCLYEDPDGCREQQDKYDRLKSNAEDFFLQVFELSVPDQGTSE